MTPRTWLIVIVSVLLAHGVAFYAFSQMRALPKVRHVPRPNLGYKEEVFEDPKSGNRTVYREIRVSTRVAEAGEYKQMPGADPAPRWPAPAKEE